MKSVEMKSRKLEVDIKEATVVDDKSEMLVEPLSPRAAIFAHTDSTYIISTMGFDSPIDVDIFRDHLMPVLSNSRFTSLMVGDEKKSDELRWVQTTNVKIGDHLIVPIINPSLIANSLAANKFVEEYIYSLTTTPMDTSKPLWDFHILNVKALEAESIGILRTHHAIGDGSSLVSLLLSMARQVSNPDALPTIPTRNKEEGKNVGTNYYGYYWKLPWNLVLAIWWWLQLFWNTFTGILRFVATTFWFKDSDMLIIASPNTKTIPRRIVFKTISLDDMKLVKNAMSATINDVALGITEAGFSRYLVRRFSKDCNVGERKTSSLLKEKRMTITMAVNLRPVKGIQSLGDMKDKGTKSGWGNQIGFVLLPLSIELRNDPLEYVRKAKAFGDRMKHSFEARCSLKINQMATKLFGIKVAGSMWLNYSNHVSVLFSNVPGPVEEIAFFGHPLKFIAPSLYALSTPVVIHFQSYVNKMTIALSVREDALVDPHQLGDDIAQSLLLFKDVVIMKGKMTPAYN